MAQGSDFEGGVGLTSKGEILSCKEFTVGYERK